MTIPAAPVLSQAAACPAKADWLTSPDILVMRTGLAVNPDGAAASYAPGDHGFTYINNGVNMIGPKGEKQGCSEKAFQATCREKWKMAEAGDFGPGTPMFCSYAIAVAPARDGQPLTPCEKDGRRVIGGGKGVPARGQAIVNVDGQKVLPYRSTTTLRHIVGGREQYTDSSVLPALVAPKNRAGLIGSIAWVRYGGRSTYAIFNDVGPSFGEGSVALHEVLRHGSVQNTQRIGPISIAKRCSDMEQLRPPFTSRPDGGDVDRCRTGYTPTTPSDIRAYGAIAGGVETVVLAKVKPSIKGRVATMELTADTLKVTAAAAGYDEAKLEMIARCRAR